MGVCLSRQGGGVGVCLSRQGGGMGVCLCHPKVEVWVSVCVTPPGGGVYVCHSEVVTYAEDEACLLGCV